MTDSEIIKALECCSNKEVQFCTLCPMFMQDKENDFCQEDLAKKALVLINCQKAEINELTEGLESLNDEVERLKEYKKYQPVGCPNCHRGNFSNDKFCSHCGYPLKKQIAKVEEKQAEIERYKGVIKILENDVKNAKSEAIKEFAERVKDRIAQHRATIVFESKLVNAVLDLAVSTMEVALKEMTEQKE